MPTPLTVSEPLRRNKYIVMYLKQLKKVRVLVGNMFPEETAP